MQIPQIQMIPLRAAISANRPVSLDVLVKVIPPPLSSEGIYRSNDETKHPRLNLSLVIDRSSSMSVKRRLVFAKAAARHIVQNLAVGDRVSIVTFDRHIQVPVPSCMMDGDPTSIIHAIESIQIGKWTNLHGGWVEGGEQVNQHIYPDTVNRVILLTDGWPSTGVRNRSTITEHVQELAETGISTTAVGVGLDYNEDLLEAIATKGDGNYYYISAPEQLPQAFEREMQALIATVGQQVTLGIQPQNEADIDDVLNDLDLTPQGRFKLPNLVAGYPFNVVLRLAIPPLSPTVETNMDGPDFSASENTTPSANSVNLCTFRLNWTSPSGTPDTPLRESLRLPIVPHSDMDNYPLNPEVQQQVALLLAARLKRKAVNNTDRKNYDAAQACLQEAKDHILNAPSSQLLELDLVAIEALEADLRSRQLRQFRKRSRNEAYQTSAGFDQTSGSFIAEGENWF